MIGALATLRLRKRLITIDVVPQQLGYLNGTTEIVREIRTFASESETRRRVDF